MSYSLGYKFKSFFVKTSVLLAVIAVRLLRPFVLIRFGRLSSERIGHFAIETELYLCEREVGLYGRRAIDIFYHNQPICNYQLKKMWERILRVFFLAALIDKLNRRLPGGGPHVFKWRQNPSIDIHGLLGRTKTHLSFTAEEEEFGRETLRKIGIPDNAPFICFHPRDRRYLDTVFPAENWRYHDFRDANVNNFIPAMKEMSCRGYYALRMGVFVEEVLNTDNPKIIDYAKKHRTDFLDIYLSGKCRFFLGTSSGINWTATIFRRPVAWTNLVSLEYLPRGCGNDLFIPKKLWLRKQNRFMTFREIFNSETRTLAEAETFERLEIDVIENTPEEITALAVELDERLNNTWQIHDEDKRLQKRFRELYLEPNKFTHISSQNGEAGLPRIGAEFLRHNKTLLE